MKTYKTWEVIKMLTENPELKFKSDLGNTLCFNKGVLCWDKNNFRETEPFILYSNYYNGLTYDNIHLEWTLIQEPLTFKEVLDTKYNDCEFRIEHNLIEDKYSYYLLDEWLYDLGEQFNEREVRDIMLNGKFYLEGEPHTTKVACFR